jgi:hypothetical protein
MMYSTCEIINMYLVKEMFYASVTSLILIMFIKKALRYKI